MRSPPTSWWSSRRYEPWSAGITVATATLVIIVVVVLLTLR